MPRDTRLHHGRSFETVDVTILRPDPVSTFLYKVYDLSRGWVYVGITSDIAMRWSAHRSGSWWFPAVDVDRVVVHGFTERSDARKAEALAIEHLDPPFNTKRENRWLDIARREPPARSAALWLLTAKGVRSVGS